MTHKPRLSAKSTAAKQARTLEKSLTNLQDQLTVRLRLIALYESSKCSENLKEQLFCHVLWLIESSPDHDSFQTMQSKKITRHQFSLARKAWLIQVESNPADLTVLRNAARFLESKDPKTAIDLLNYGKILDKTTSSWSRQLCQLYHFKAVTGRHVNRKHFASLALRELENFLAYRRKGDLGELAGLVTSMCNFAIQQRDFHRAQLCIQELLKLGRIHRVRLWQQYGLLFQTTLAANLNQRLKTKRSLALLLKSLRIEPTHVALNSLMMGVLSYLLSLGEKATVIDSLKVCVLVKDAPVNQIAQWQKQINSGRTPKFHTLQFDMC